MYPITNEVMALFESEQRKVLRITGKSLKKDNVSVGPSDIVTVNDAAAIPAKDITIAIDPVQSGSGDPSPTNVRPISGWTGANVVVSPTTDAQDGTTYLISWQSEAGTVYGGTLDVTTGLLTVTMAKEIFDGTESWTYQSSVNASYTQLNSLVKSLNYSTLMVCDKLAAFNVFNSEVFLNADNAISAYNDTSNVYPNQNWVYVKISGVTSAADLKTWLASNPITLVYELATPQTYQLSPIDVTLLLGDNNVWADTGETTLTYRPYADLIITDNNVIADSFQIDRYSCNGEKLEVGTAIAAEMKFTLDNADGQFDGVVFEGAELFVEVGVADWTQENPAVNWVPCGYFTPDMQPRRLTTISVTALDRMAKFDVVVDATDLTFPTTIAGLVGQVCTVCGVTLAQSIATLTNADVAVATLPSANGGMITYRNLIQWCAGVMGTNAWFDWNGLLRFSWYNNATNYVSTMDNRYSSDLYENDLTVTGVEYTNDSGVVFVEGTDDYSIDLTGNAIAGPLIATVLPSLNTALNGFTYRPFTAAVVNAPYLWPMDVVTFTDKNGKNHTGALTNVAFELNGSTSLESKGMTYAINKAAQPKGFTREQAQLVNQIVAKNVESHIDDYLTQQEIFNRLTDNGAAQGLVLYNGQLYINASYVNAGMLNVGLINFRDYTPPYHVPNEFDPDSLFSGQVIQDGWIVNRNGSSDIGIIGCDFGDAVPLRGRTLTVTLTSRSHITTESGGYDYIDEHGEIWTETLPETDTPAYGSEDAEGNLNGATDNGEYEQYSTSYRVPDNAMSFYLAVRCTGVKNITVSESYSKNFGLRYGNNIGLNYKGLQVGKFVVDRSGNATFNGDAIFNGDVALKNPLPLAQGGTGATTAAGARTNIGAAAASDVKHVYINTGLIGHPLDTSSYYISFETVGKNVYITFRGESRTHAEDEVFLVIPEGFRSGGDRYFPAAINNVACGVVMRSNGNVSIWSPNPPSGRIFLSMAYCIE